MCNAHPLDYLCPRGMGTVPAQPRMPRSVYCASLLGLSMLRLSLHYLPSTISIMGAFGTISVPLCPSRKPVIG